MINRHKSIVTYDKGFSTQALPTLVKNMELQLQVIQLLLQFNNGSISYESQQQKRKIKFEKKEKNNIVISNRK
jgi:hypothetical protein